MTDPTERPTAADDECIVPLFPLKGVFLFPGLLQALHIFEPRYRQMVEDLLDRSGSFVIGTVLDATDEEMMENPAIEPVGGLGRIEFYRRYDDGRFNVLVHGLARVEVAELESDRLYRKVRYTKLPEVGCSDEESAELVPRLRKAVTRVLKKAAELPDDLSVSQLVDLLLFQLTLPDSELHQLYSEPLVTERARAVLALHGYS